MNQSPSPLEFGEYRLDSEVGQLWHGNHEVELQPRRLAVLRYLAERPGEIISKEELLQNVWEGTYVSRTTLKVCIRAIRAALGDDAQQPRYIETVGRDGYRFIGTETIPEEPPQPLSSGIVGREGELAQLHEALQKALGGTRQVVFVTGEAGVGKTTLVDQFLAQVQGLPSVWIGRGQCIEQYGEGEAYLPVLEALSQFSQAPGSKGSEGRERLPAILRRYAPTWLVQLPVLLNDTEQESLQRQVQGATRERMLREMAEALGIFSADHVLLLILEDLHWSDVSTLELLSYVAQRRQAAQLMVIGTYRPADIIVHGHPLREAIQELFAKEMATELPLELLTQESVTEYVSSRLGSEAGAAQLGQLIHQRTEGNALFMVNVVDQLVEQGVTNSTVPGSNLDRVEQAVEAIPSSLWQLIDKQLGRLSAEQQRTLEIASVVGTEFAAASVAAGLESHVDEADELCEELVSQGQFIEEVGFADWPDGTPSGVYRFRHSLYQNVLYDRISTVRKIRLHRAIGEREEAGYGKQAHEYAAALARHFEQGRDPERAWQYYKQAGEAAVRRSANQEAVGHFTKSIALLTSLPKTREQSQQELALQVAIGAPLVAMKGLAAPEVEQAYDRARELCTDQIETAQTFPILIGLHVFYTARGRLQVGAEFAEQSLRFAQKEQAPEFLLEAHTYMGNSLFWRGDILAARDHLEQAVPLYGLQHHDAHAFIYGQDPGVVANSELSWITWMLGYPDRSSRYSQEAMAIADSISHAHSSAFAASFAAWLCVFRGEWLDCQRWAERVEAIASEHSLPLWLGLGICQQGAAAVAQAQASKGLKQMYEGNTIYRSTGAELGLPWNLLTLADWCGKTQAVDEGNRVLEEAFLIAQQNGETLWAAELQRCKGELLLQSKDENLVSRRAEAEVCFQRAITIAQSQQAKAWELRAAMSLSRLWQQQGKTTEARDLLAPIYDWFTEGFETADLKEAQALLETLSDK